MYFDDLVKAIREADQQLTASDKKLSMPGWRFGIGWLGIIFRSMNSMAQTVRNMASAQ